VGDTLPVLLSLDARIELASAAGSRSLPADDITPIDDVCSTAAYRRLPPPRGLPPGAPLRAGVGGGLTSAWNVRASGP